MHKQTSPSPPARIQRHDGWTPERIRIFLYALRDGKSVTAAAGAAGMSRQGAYAYRAGANGRYFAVAWRAARELAHRQRVDGVMAEIATKRLRRLRRLIGPRHVVELPGTSKGQRDPDEMQLWFR